MSFSAIHLRNRYGIYLRRKRNSVRVRYSIAPEKNQEDFFGRNCPCLDLTIGEKTLKSLIG